MVHIKSERSRKNVLLGNCKGNFLIFLNARRNPVPARPSVRFYREIGDWKCIDDTYTHDISLQDINAVGNCVRNNGVINGYVRKKNEGGIFEGVEGKKERRGKQEYRICCLNMCVRDNWLYKVQAFVSLESVHYSRVVINSATRDSRNKIIIEITCAVSPRETERIAYVRICLRRQCEC